MLMPKVAAAAAAILMASSALGAPPSSPGGSQSPGIVSGNTSVATYSASKAFANAGTGDLFCIYGSTATPPSVVKVKGIRVTGSGGTNAALLEMSVVRRSTLDTGGGLTAITPVPSDPLNGASTAQPMYFTSAPTPGTLVGNVRDRYMTFSGTTAPVAGSEGLFQFSVYWDQPQILRKSTDGICIIPSSAGSGWAIDAEFSEE